MNASHAGGCACGAVRYEATGTPIAEIHCQCRDCQKRSGTGHSSYLVFGSRAGVELTGTASEWEVIGDSGNPKRHAFCPTCGTPVYLTFPARPEMIAFHATSLDDPDRFAPALVTYTSRGRAWDRIDPALRQFETMPPG